MQAENERLKAENIRLREWYQTALVLQARQDSLEKLMNLKLPPQHHYITARVIADSGNSYVQSVIVLAGSPDGVRKGQAAISDNGVVGRVIETGDRSARILLLTDMNSRIPVMIEGKNDHAILAGNNDSYPELLHLPADTKAEAGDRIVTSGHGGMFPPGLPVGELIALEDGRMAVRPVADLDRLGFVRVVDYQAVSGL
ncbi:MAG: rod shape-determining protein MreC [Rhodospirillales bacterium]|nr:rod shape-determining protein MreC [Rhodospirillales bacterium]